MIEIEFVVPRGCDLSQATQRIERSFTSCGLRISMKGTLRGYPGCVHWHVKRDPEAGTLEVTLWETKQRIWASVQDGRRAAWIEEALKNVKHEIETALSNAVS